MVAGQESDWDLYAKQEFKRQAVLLPRPTKAMKSLVDAIQATEMNNIAVDGRTGTAMIHWNGLNAKANSLFEAVVTVEFRNLGAPCIYMNETTTNMLKGPLSP